MTINRKNGSMGLTKLLLLVLFIFGLAYLTVLSATSHKSKVWSFVAAIIITFLLFAYTQKYLERHNGKLVHKNY